MEPHRFKPVQAATGIYIATGSAAQGSAFGARVNCNDAAGQILVFDAREARVLNHGREVLLRRELPDGLHQVLVARLVPRHQPAAPGGVLPISSPLRAAVQAALAPVLELRGAECVAACECFAEAS